jgi:MFS family permease
MKSGCWNVAVGTLTLRLLLTTTTIIIIQLRSIPLASASFVVQSSSAGVARRNTRAPSAASFVARSPRRRSIAIIVRAQPKGDEVDETITKDGNSSWAWLPTLVLPLWFVYVSNQWSRSSIYYLVNFDVSSSDAFTAMNVDIGFGEAQYGVLASLAFTSLFAIASLGAGFASDRYNRKTLTVLSAVCWSAATLGTAFADSYEAILACRIAMGLACAFSTPTAYTLIRDNVPKARSATASSFYGTGVALGSGLASLSLLLDNAVGWRQALNAIAATGFASAAASFVLLPNDDDKKTSTDIGGSTDDTAKEGLGSILVDMQGAFSTNRSQWIYLGSFLRFCSGLCIGVWGAPYFRMVFDDRTTDYSVTQAAISAIGASCSGILGGAIADKLSFSDATNESDTRDLVGRRLWVPVVGSILAAPTWYFAVHSPDSFEVSMTWLAAEYFVAECWFGPTISTLQATVGPKIGGTAQGLFTLTGAMANFAPTILGYLYGQAVSGGTEGGDVASDELSSLLSAAVCFGYLSSAFCFGMAARSPPSSLEDSNNATKQS